MHFDSKRASELEHWLREVLNSDGIPCGAENLRSSLPERGGIYFFSEVTDHETVVYIGRCGNIRQRVYQNHIMGDAHSSQMKNALIHFVKASSWEDAKEYLRSHFVVRFSLIEGFEERDMREGYAKAILKPKYSLYKSKEH